jgi:AraC-like DNA-binding protein
MIHGRPSKKRRFFTILQVEFSGMIALRTSTHEGTSTQVKPMMLGALLKTGSHRRTDHKVGCTMERLGTVHQKQMSPLDQQTMPLTVPRDGIWLRLAQTLEGTVCRSSYAKQILSSQQFNAARTRWTLADLTFLRTALELLYNTQGQIRMSALAADCGLSLRQFERRFQQRIGVSPKVFARLLRFEALLTSLIQEPASSLADIASHLGYQDQAHVIHEFKTWAGCTPTAFLARAKQRAMRGPLIPDPRPAYPSVYIIWKKKEGSEEGCL